MIDEIENLKRALLHLDNVIGENVDDDYHVCVARNRIEEVIRALEADLDDGK